MNPINLHMNRLMERRCGRPPWREEEDRDAFDLREADLREGTSTEGDVHFAAKMHLFYELGSMCNSEKPLHERGLRSYIEYTIPKKFFRNKVFSWAKLDAFKQSKWRHFQSENSHIVPLPSRSDELFGPRCFVFDLGFEDKDRLVAAVEVVDTSYPTEGKKNWCRFHDVTLLTIKADWVLRYFADTDIMYVELEDGRRAPLKTFMDESTWYRV